MRQVPRLRLKDATTQRALDQITSTVNALVKLWSSDSVILERVELKPGRNAVPHKLGRRLKGWTLVRSRGVTIVYDQQDANSTPDETLLLYSTSEGSVVVDLLVF